MSDEPEVLEEAEPEAAVEVVDPMAEVDPMSVTAQSPKKYIRAALSVEFEVRVGATRTIEERIPFKSGPNAGVARPPLEVSHLWVIAKHPAARFKLHFKNNRFSEAWVWDAAGWPTELWYDYTPSTNALKQRKDEPEWAWQERVRILNEDVRRREFEYNDGEFWTNVNLRMLTVGASLDEWFADFVPGFTVPKKREKKQDQSEATAVDLIEIGEWTG